MFPVLLKENKPPNVEASRGFTCQPPPPPPSVGAAKVRERCAPEGNDRRDSQPVTNRERWTEGVAHRWSDVRRGRSPAVQVERAPESGWWRQSGCFLKGEESFNSPLTRWAAPGLHCKSDRLRQTGFL
ncbi:Hypothetical predicted protein [Podarcis lilfordi]|uniref:Uncharacterized protein n=1 Tax=Podarcis lilfordi TaxID=74358 RepID=A0AA35KNK6_9SAUR|nr:Hypothetical predicted protein [Podarcis lilfordi]